MKAYIAAPFFNARELAVVERVEGMLDAAGIEYFSPRTLGRPNDADERREIFDTNYNHIMDCDIVLAWLDRIHADDRLSVRMVRDVTDIHPPQAALGSSYTIDSGPLIQPDLGTVWEMGAVYALDRPCVGFTHHTTPTDARLNLMLAESVDGIVYGLDQLEKMLTKPLTRWGSFYNVWIGKGDEDVECT